MPFQSADVLILNQQLKVQEVSIRFADVGLYSASGSVVTVDFNEPLDAIVCVLHLDNSGPTPVLNAAASNVITSDSVAITLASAFAANDVLIIKYIVV